MFKNPIIDFINQEISTERERSIAIVSVPWTDKIIIYANMEPLLWISALEGSRLILLASPLLLIHMYLLHMYSSPSTIYLFYTCVAIFVTKCLYITVHILYSDTKYSFRMKHEHEVWVYTVTVYSDPKHSFKVKHVLILCVILNNYFYLIEHKSLFHFIRK